MRVKSLVKTKTQNLLRLNHKPSQSKVLKISRTKVCMEEKGLYFMQMDQNMSANLEMVISTAEVKFLDLMDNISMKSNELISY